MKQIYSNKDKSACFIKKLQKSNIIWSEGLLVNIIWVIANFSNSTNLNFGEIYSEQSKGLQFWNTGNLTILIFLLDSKK
jgi:hypothetical protein